MMQTEFTLPDIKWLHDAEAIERPAHASAMLVVSSTLSGELG